MPELPDIVVYVEALQRMCLRELCTSLQVRSPFVLRTADVPPTSVVQQRVTDVGRMGKRLVLTFEGGTCAVIHLTIAGRLVWGDMPPKPTTRTVLAVFSFTTGHLVFTEASTKKRAGLWLFASAQAARALTDPRRFDGIGNAFSDDILHAARLSPVRLTQKLTEAEVRRLHTAIVDVLDTWTERLRRQTGEAFPKNVTAFRHAYLRTRQIAALRTKARHGCEICGAVVRGNVGRRLGRRVRHLRRRRWCGRRAPVAT